MQWQQALLEVKTLSHAGRPTAEIRDVQYDSRRVHLLDAFVAMQGGSVDGNLFIDRALQAGAAAILTDSAEVFTRLRERQPELALALVDKGRRALAELSAAVFGHPERQLALSAVTGTNGKTTTTFLLEQLLQSAGRQDVLLGTVETRVAGEVRASEHTTPESRDILAIFRDGVRAGCTEAIMEMSSHALAQERVWGVPVDVAIFTNLTQDHLDFHASMQDYAEAKARLFCGVGAPAPRVAVINQDADYASTMVDGFRGETLMTYGLGAYGTHRANELVLRPGETHFTFITPEGSLPIRSPLSGRVNVYNLLAAMCAALARGLTPAQIAAATPKLRQVPGRFEIVPGSREAGFLVVVDYAHTEDALRNLTAMARDAVQPHAGRVLTLFGCGGDRDRSKRPRMGRVAGEGSDFVVLTSDNPRSENPAVILQEAEAGLRATATPYTVEPDRRSAIATILRAAREGDLVLLAGKGHEKYQITANGTQPFDDVAEAAEVLRALSSESLGAVALS